MRIVSKTYYIDEESVILPQKLRSFLLVHGMIVAQKKPKDKFQFFILSLILDI